MEWTMEWNMDWNIDDHFLYLVLVLISSMDGAMAGATASDPIVLDSPTTLPSPSTSSPYSSPLKVVKAKEKYRYVGSIIDTQTDSMDGT